MDPRRKIKDRKRPARGKKRTSESLLKGGKRLPRLL
jgi:hypothetical protein